MGIVGLDDLSDIHLDVLKEIGNIGSGTAASAMSTMLGRPIHMNVPKVSILSYNQAVANLGGAERLVVGILLTLRGDVEGMMMFLLHKEFVHRAMETLTGDSFNPMDELDELTSSAIREVGNIMAGSYVGAISELTGLTIDISPPGLAVDMVGSILSVPNIYFADMSDKMIWIEDDFDKQEEAVGSRILLMPQVDGLERIMESLGLSE